MTRPVVLLFAAACMAYPQQPKFDVASVKPAGEFIPGAFGRIDGGPGTADPGRITFTGVSLQTLLIWAYNVRPDQISGPAWLDGETFKYAYTISATFPTQTTMEQFRPMLQALLAERFHLTLHHETRGFPGYNLVLAPGGTKLKEASPEASPRRGSRFVTPPPDAKPVDEIPALPSGMASVTRTPPRGQWGTFRSTYHVSIADFLRGLGAMVNESTGVEMGKNVPRINDKTGLTGIYEFTLEFAGISIIPIVEESPTETGARDPGNGGGQTIFVALEKQLGLSLEKTQSVPVDTLVIDHAEKTPGEN